MHQYQNSNIQTGVKLKIQRAIFYCLLLALISYGLNYHIGKAFLHLATLLSIANILIAIKNKSFSRIATNKPTIIMVSLLLLSSIITFAYFTIFNNPASERHFSNVFYPTLLFSIILPSLKVKKTDSYTILYSAIISCIVMASSGIIDYISSGNPAHRTSGFLNMPIIYASTMVLLTSWIFAEMCKHLLSQKWLIAIICFLAACAGFSAVLFTASRGPIIVNTFVMMMLLAHYVYSLPSNNKKLYTVIAAVITCATISLFMPQSKLLDNIKNRFQTGINNVSTGFEGEKRAPTSAGIRLDVWEASLVTIMDHPLTGIGSGNHTKYFPILDQEGRINVNTDIIIGFDHMHNDFIQAWLSMGLIFGTLAFFFVIYPALLFAYQAINGKPAMIGLAVCICFILCGITDVPAHNASSLTLFLLIICLQLSLRSNDFSSAYSKKMKEKV